MWRFQLARKNMWRNKHRTIITMTAIFFAVILSVLTGSLKEGIFDNLLKNVVSFYTGYIQIHQRGYWAEQTLDNSFTWSDNLGTLLRKQENVSNFSPRLESYALAASDKTTKGCRVVGIDPEAEDKITSLKQKLVKGSYLNPQDASLLIAEGLAERLGVTVNDTLYLIGQGYHAATAAGKYRIKGILHFGSPDLNANGLFLPLTQAQELFAAENRVNTLVVMVNDDNLLQQTKAQIEQDLSADYEVLTWEEMIPDIKQHIATDSNNMKYVQYILYLLICFGILGTLIMMMMERQYEMGMLIAIGMKRSQLATVMVIESLMTLALGCLLGLLASYPITYYFEKYPLRMGGEIARAYERFGFEAVFPASTDPQLFIEQGSTVLILGLLLSLYPTIKILRIDPVASMKR
jgi:ABC-type lipoprotein release transport system permease subunit